MPMKIYLAGKIGKNDWRHDIVGTCLSDACSDFYAYGRQDETAQIAMEWPVLPKAIFAEYDYTGPYFVACDHGCFHGIGTHG